MHQNASSSADALVELRKNKNLEIFVIYPKREWVEYLTSVQCAPTLELSSENKVYYIYEVLSLKDENDRITKTYFRYYRNIPSRRAVFDKWDNCCLCKKILKKYILNIHIILKGKVMNAKFSSGATGKKVLKITCLINFERWSLYGLENFATLLPARIDRWLAV